MEQMHVVALAFCAHTKFNGNTYLRLDLSQTDAGIAWYIAIPEGFVYIPDPAVVAVLEEAFYRAPEVELPLERTLQ